MYISFATNEFTIIGPKIIIINSVDDFHTTKKHVYTIFTIFL